MERLSNNDGNSVLAENEDDDVEPPSPTLSNSPPSMVVSRPEISEDNYRYYLQRQQDIKTAEQLPLMQRRNSNVEAIPEQRRPLNNSKTREYQGRFFSGATGETWRLKEAAQDSRAVMHPGVRSVDDVSALGFDPTSAAVAAAAALSAAGMNDEERARNAAATAAFWAGFRQAAAAAVVASTSKAEDLAPSNFDSPGKPRLFSWMKYVVLHWHD